MMPVEKWSDKVNVVRLADDPQFTDDVETLQEQYLKNGGSAVLDFSAVRFINSSNISRLLRLHKQAAASQTKIILCSIDTKLWGTFISIGLDKVFDFSDNVTTALATLQIS
jgi:anti-anti-sigma factor